MKKSFFGLIILFIFLTTYTPKFDFIIGFDFSVQKIEIECNSILNSNEIVQKLNFLYRENLFFLDLMCFITCMCMCYVCVCNTRFALDSSVQLSVVAC